MAPEFIRLLARMLGRQLPDLRYFYDKDTSVQGTVQWMEEGCVPEELVKIILTTAIEQAKNREREAKEEAKEQELRSLERERELWQRQEREWQQQQDAKKLEHDRAIELKRLELEVLKLEMEREVKPKHPHASYDW